ncbi:hypothetical protein AAVH_30096 [Aphelenchoides avenae]|nr:hypothetical protein AAVH_30096 [Aphelenchus avenae]
MLKLIFVLLLVSYAAASEECTKRNCNECCTALAGGINSFGRCLEPRKGTSNLKLDCWCPVGSKWCNEWLPYVSARRDDAATAAAAAALAGILKDMPTVKA